MPRKIMPVVRVILENLEGKVLFLKRKSSQHGERKLCLPGGKIEFGQTIEQAVRDELKTETGLDALDLKFLFPFENLPKDEDSPHVINFCHYSRYDGKSEIALNEESSEYFWLAPEEMTGYDIAFENDVAVRRYFDSKE